MVSDIPPRHQATWEDIHGRRIVSAPRPPSCRPARTRIDRTQLHRLPDIIAIDLHATIADADADSWPEVERFVRARRDWLGRFLALPNGIPSHDASLRVFARGDPARFAKCASSWLAEVGEVDGLRPIAIDGKAARSAPSGSPL